jgi:O-methyltransferase involved in polyketide biosynthesis
MPPGRLAPAARAIFDRVSGGAAAVNEAWISFFDPPEIERVLHDAGFRNVIDVDGPALNQRYFNGGTGELRVGSLGHLTHASTDA